MKPIPIDRRGQHDDATPGQHFRAGMSPRTFCLWVAIVGTLGLLFSL